MESALVCLASMLVLAQPPAVAQPQAAAQPRAVVEQGHAQLPYCVVSPVEEIELAAQEAGVLIQLQVREGVSVAEGDLLANIDNADVLVRKKAAELELQVARAEAANDIDVRAAMAAAKVAAAEVEESDAVNRKAPGSIPETQVRRQRLTRERAQLQVQVAEVDFNVAGLTAEVKQAQVDVAELQIQRRRVLSPLEGRVEQLYKQRGEWVNPGEPILRLVRMDRLRVEGFLKASEFSPDEVDGQPVAVEVVLERGRRERFEGKIEFVSSAVEASGEYRVWAEVKNRRTPGGHWLLRTGTPAQMVILLRQ